MFFATAAAATWDAGAILIRPSRDPYLYFDFGDAVPSLKSFVGLFFNAFVCVGFDVDGTSTTGASEGAAVVGGRDGGKASS